MGTVSIPVDIANPGQVFACLGLLEAADLLYGPSEGCFDWDNEGEPQFILKSEQSEKPVEDILAFLVDATAFAVAPYGWVPPKGDATDLKPIGTFPANEPDNLSLPIVLQDTKGKIVSFGHWADGSGRDNFKLYAGNRSALKIANDMLQAIAHLWEKQHNKLISDPFGTLCGMGGSFNFDPRGAWTALDVGYSLNDLKKAKVLEQKVMASPAVELLAAWGLEHARPDEISLRYYCYAVWDRLLPPQLARVAMSGNFAPIQQRRYRFQLDMSGKNKIIRYATEETTP
ncbi:MAG: type I-U CRISPR-associated protein Cas8c [Methylobacter sp.]|nr:type I-U CRISPR-associated protein Cas8c [Methylobacter sp.]